MCNEVDVHLGRKLFIRRRILGMTQKQLAVACGVRFQQIQKYECGANRMSALRLWQLAQALEVPMTYFFDGLSHETLVEVGAQPSLKGRRTRRAATEDGDRMVA
jgi:transcriptional regulator with XRE-family HTH domain